MNAASPQPILSPCVNVCEMDDDGLCEAPAHARRKIAAGRDVAADAPACHRCVDPGARDGSRTVSIRATISCCVNCAACCIRSMRLPMGEGANTPLMRASLRGDKIQMSGMREIPGPRITLVPAAVKLVGMEASDASPPPGPPDRE